MSRFDTKDEADASRAAEVELGIIELHGGSEPAFRYRDEEGSLIGCYAPLGCSDPIIIKPWFDLARAIYRQTHITARSRELSIFALASVYDAPYVNACHKPLSLKLGFSEEQIASAAAGAAPQGINEKERVAYEFARELAAARGPVPQKRWEEVCTTLTKDEALAVSHVVSGYLYVVTLLNMQGPATGLERGEGWVA